MKTRTTLLLAALAALLLPAAHAAPVQLTTNAATDSLPHWHPTNGKIGYGRYNGSSWDIATVNTDGTGEMLIGTGLGLNGYHNAIGWVGSTNTMMAAETVFFHELLAFDTTQAPAARTTSDGAQGTVFVPKLTVPGGNNSNVMVVSRDGTRMVWRDTVNASTNIQIRTALYSSLANQSTATHGTLVFSSTNSGTGTRGMALTANGDTLVISIVTGSNFELWRYPTSGGAGTQLTSDATATSGNINPSISPDGTKILWQRFTATDSDVWMMNLDGTDKVNITQTASFSEGAPTWAPDGVQYAFAGGDGNLYKDTIPVAEQPPGATVTIDFNDLPLGLQSSDFLAGYGIPSVTYGGTGPGAGGPTIYDNTGSNHVIPSPPKLLAQGGTSNDPNMTHFLRFNFTPELSAFSLKRTGKNGGGSTDTWRAYFYNAAGTLLGDFGESTPIINAPVTTFSFTAPVGETIARMDLVSIWTGFATNRNIPVDDFTLTRAATTTPADTATQTPTLTSPATGTTTSSPVSVSFNLPEAALAGSVKLAFGTRILTLAASQETSGAHSFSLDPANPAGAPEVASMSGGTSIPDDTYTVTLSYQDSLGNPVASAASTGVVIDTMTQAPVLAAPVDNAIVTTSTLTVSYTLPEAAFPGSVQLVFTGAAERTIVLTTSAQEVGTHMVSFSRANPLASADVASITGGSDIPDGYPYQISLKYKDALNNSEASDGANLVRIDSTAPAVSVPANIITEATGPGGAAVTFSVSALDNVDGPVAASAVPPSGSTFGIGTTTVNVSATDMAGNIGMNSFTVTVQDTAPPSGGTFTVSPPSPVMGGTLLTGNFAGWLDAVSGVLTYSVRLGAVVIVPPGTDATPDFMLPAGTHLLTGRVFDGAGNFTDVGPVSVTVDGMAPTLTLPANITTEAVGANGAVVSFTVGASDDLDPNPVVTVNPPSGSLFPIGPTTVNVTATDAAGNQSAGSFTVTVQDTTGPIFTTVPPPQSDTASAGTGTAPVPDIVSLAEATDAVGVVSITQSPVAGTELPPGLHNIRLTARDAEDNEGIADVPFTVHVAPEAVDDVGFASKVVIFIDVLANDSLPAGSIITSVSPPSIGQARIENGMVRYTPPSTGLISSATFTYTAGVDPNLDTAAVTVRPMADAVGTFVGLLQRTDSTVRGRVLLTVAANGGMSGSVRFEGRSFPARAAVNGTMLTLSGTNPKPVPATLDRGAPDGIGQPTFIVALPDSVPGQTLTATAERSPYKATNPAPQAGRYTIIADLPVGGSGPETAAALSCVVANDGKVTFGGKFSAAIAVTQAGKVLHGGRLPFFVSKGTGATMQGLGGELVFDPSGSPDVTGTLRWNVPAGTAKLASGVAQDYDAIGQLYVPPALASGMFSPAVPTATLTLTAPSLGASSPLVRVLSLTNPPVNGLRNISFPGGFINLRVNTGLFTGTCTLSGSRTYFGAVLQGSPTNAGQGTLLDTTSLQPVTFAP